MMTSVATPKVNFLVKSKSPTKPLPETMKYLFIFFRVVFALNFGFTQFQSSRLKRTDKLLSFIQASVLFVTFTYLFFYSHSNPYSTWYFLDVAIYYIFAIILLASKNSYHDFQLDLYAFDSEIGMDSSKYKVEHKMFLACFILFIFKCSLFASYCVYYQNYCNFPVWIMCGYFIAMLGVNIVILSYAFLFQSVHYRMKKFMSFVKNDNTDVVSCHYLYKTLVEVTEKMKKSYDLVVSWYDMICNFNAKSYQNKLAVYISSFIEEY